ncbi:hypothetical protein [Weissella halotolerans]|uniref:Uncharacterized protein n=1 Tax=Weissella halotolerans DSM 20190 TaxID=1123500 RepID=A0A0R2G615_9LACO|nr:hypothetical protein [Weissella halotolerans]KRN32205.1 hypothetical protein IV68_GL000554 [Weissella halotolerans DSM 20190]
MPNQQHPTKTFEDQWILHQIVSQDALDFKAHLVKVSGIYYRFTIVTSSKAKRANHYIVSATEGNRLILSPYQVKE